jgi:hypothetical protein
MTLQNMLTLFAQSGGRQVVHPLPAQLGQHPGKHLCNGLLHKR